MLSRLATHVRAHLVGYLALFVALGGRSLAATGGLPPINGTGKIFSNRIEVSPPVSYPTFTGPGPVVLEVPGFGEILVTSCPDFVTTVSTQLAFRNTSGVIIDAPGTFSYDIANPGNVLIDSFPPGLETLVSDTGSIRWNVSDTTVMGFLQLGAGAAEHRRVATVNVGGFFDPAANTCRFNAQAIVHGS